MLKDNRENECGEEGVEEGAKWICFYNYAKKFKIENTKKEKRQVHKWMHGFMFL